MTTVIWDVFFEGDEHLKYDKVKGIAELPSFQEDLLKSLFVKSLETVMV